jgi:dipeptidyl aminopeptidase/acylaminoacyl peptidase
VPERTTYAIRNGAGLAGSLGDTGEVRVGWLGPDGAFVAAGRLPDGAAVAAVTSRGAALISGTAAGPQRLAWAEPDGTLRPLMAINRRLAGLAWPLAVRADQTASDGEILHHWILLPPDAQPGARLPVIVIPYLGNRYGTTAPRPWDDGVMWPATTLVGEGYAVLLPSLPVEHGNGGPAKGLAAQILAAVDAVAATPSIAGRIDPERLGAWGHSFGGYGVEVLLTQTDRFAAGVAVEPPADLVSFWGRSSPARRANPDEGPGAYYSAGWTENLQGDMRAPPWAAPERYLANSPLFAADRIHTPLLLVAGDQDGDHLGQAEEMFSALYRQSKDAELLTYWGEAHVFGSPGDLRDVYRRGVAFLDAKLRPQHLRPSAPVDGGGRPGPRLESSSANDGSNSPKRRPAKGPAHPPGG